MKRYNITTDDGTLDTEAESVAAALAEYDAPARDAEGFARWLRESGGYGYIEENGVRLIEVGKDAG